ncbi:MAG: YfiR family protein [Bacteroidota bacterium]
MKTIKLTFLLLLLMATGFSANTQEKFRVQAMFVYNFARMTAWPQSYQSGDFVIGVYGSTPVYKEMSDLSSMRSVGNQPVTIKQFDNVADLEDCHILFIAPNQSRQVEEITNTLKRNNIHALVITEGRNTLAKGSVINFIIENDRPRYELSLANAQKMGLTLGAEISRLASSVK